MTLLGIVYAVVAALVLGFGVWREAGIPADKRRGEQLLLWFACAALWPVAVVGVIVGRSWCVLCRLRGTEPWSKNDDDDEDRIGPPG